MPTSRTRRKRVKDLKKILKASKKIPKEVKKPFDEIDHSELKIISTHYILFLEKISFYCLEKDFKFSDKFKVGDKEIDIKVFVDEKKEKFECTIYASDDFEYKDEVGRLIHKWVIDLTKKYNEKTIDLIK